MSRGWWFLACIPPRPKELLTSRARREVHLSCEPLARGQIARHGPEHCSTLGLCLPGTASSGRSPLLPRCPAGASSPLAAGCMCVCVLLLINIPIMQIEK